MNAWVIGGDRLGNIPEALAAFCIAVSRHKWLSVLIRPASCPSGPNAYLSAGFELTALTQVLTFSNDGFWPNSVCRGHQSLSHADIQKDFLLIFLRLPETSGLRHAVATL